jgi:hypothetical protein
LIDNASRQREFLASKKRTSTSQLASSRVKGSSKRVRIDPVSPPASRMLSAWDAFLVTGYGLRGQLLTLDTFRRMCQESRVDPDPEAPIPRADPEGPRSRGFRNRDNFKTAIYFHCGGLDLLPAT